MLKCHTLDTGAEYLFKLSGESDLTESGDLLRGDWRSSESGEFLRSDLLCRESGEFLRGDLPSSESGDPLRGENLSKESGLLRSGDLLTAGSGDLLGETKDPGVLGRDSKSGDMLSGLSYDSGLLLGFRVFDPKCRSDCSGPLQSPVMHSEFLLFLSGGSGVFFLTISETLRFLSGVLLILSLVAKEGGI